MWLNSGKLAAGSAGISSAWSILADNPVGDRVKGQGIAIRRRMPGGLGPCGMARDRRSDTHSTDLMMSFALYLTTIFVVLALFGAYQGTRELRKLRAPRDYPVAIMSWTEQPLSGPRHDGLSYFMMLIHWTGVVLLAVGSLATVLLWDEAGRDFRTFTQSAAEQATWAAAALSITFTGFVTGRVLLHPFGSPFGGHSHHSLSSEGLLFGGYLLPWEAFSHYSIEADRQVIRLWSRASPGHVGFALRPLSEKQRDELGGQIATRVSPSEPRDGSKFRWTPILRIMLLTGAALGIGASLLLLFGVAGLIGVSLLLLLFMRVGGNLLMNSAYGGLAHKLLD